MARFGRRHPGSHYRRTQAKATPAALLTVELWESGSLVATFTSVPVASDGVLSFTWDASLLTDQTGAGVEVRLVASGLPIEVGAIEWNEVGATDYAVGVAGGVVSYNLTASDTRVLTESVARLISASRTAAETRTTAEVVTRSATIARPVPETRVVADVGIRSLVASRTAGETWVSGESLARLELATRTGAETRSSSEVVVRSNTLGRTAADTRITSEAAVSAVVRNYVLAVADVIAEAEAVLRGTTLARAPPDTRITADALARTAPAGRVSADTRVSADSLIRGAQEGRSGAELWSTGADQLERIAPNSILTSSHLFGVVADIDDDPDAPDTAWLTADATVGSLRVAFPSPAASLRTGAGLQEFRLRVRPRTP